MGQTCCQGTEILVTSRDRERIAAFTARTDFFERALPIDPVYLDQDDDPNWLVWAFDTDGTRHVLKREPNGDCGFLGHLGCTLPLDVRPLICRLHPYEYTEDGVTGVSSQCPDEVVPPGSTIVEVLGMVPDEAERWRDQIYAELRADHLERGGKP
ncbi:MAG: hypothetical protein H6735_00375 [Alphaproteobacteria bacterium]|nr:hypothetical protein [Alphaproteobacteria bacterium]